VTSLTIKPAKRVSGTITVPADKSISHRAVLLAALAEGKTTIENFLTSADCSRTLQAVRDLGVPVEELAPGRYCVYGKGLGALRSPSQPLDLGNSGTGLRLLAGLIAGQGISATLTGDASLCSRPMQRIVAPLSDMGAKIQAQVGDRAPLTIEGGNLRPITYTLPVASAQVKSALLLAGVQAEGKTTLIEPFPTRDHTERLLGHLGGQILRDGPQVSLEGPLHLQGKNISIPGDFSSATFLLAAALLLEGSEITVKGVGLNPTRTAFLKILQDMGAQVEIDQAPDAGYEPVGSLRLHYQPLKGVVLKDPVLIPNIIDEIPILAILASQANGKTLIRNARELRVKESDRIRVLCENLKAVGVTVEEFHDGLAITGKPGRIQGGKVDSHKDHRIAMAFAILGLFSEGGIEVSDVECIETSFPDFKETLERITHG
jgi:3-phosphoshikimate 1-carboxyvinyltransferase